MADLLIKNGHVIDPSQGIDEVCNILVSNGVISSRGQAQESAVVSIDAEGCIVTPGLIDYHTHIYYGKTGLSANAHLLPYTGVTAAVDAGSSGCENFEDFYKMQLSLLPIRAKAFLSCYTKGMAVPNNHENFDPQLYDAQRIAALLKDYSDAILGLKIRIGKELMPNLAPLKAAVSMSEQLGGIPLCVHITNSPENMGVVANMLRKGDIICHVYHGTGNTVLDENGKILDAVVEARKRGVIFDSSNGNMNNTHEVTLACLEQGFLPDIISTDLTIDKFCSGRRAKSLCFVMSKYLSMGMPLYEIVRCTTQNPAAAMGEAGRLGTLAPGTVADITIMRQQSKTIVYEDSAGKLYTGEKAIVPQWCVLGGNIYKCRDDCC